MTAENFLGQYGDICAVIKRKQRLLESLNSQMYKTTADFNTDKVQVSSSSQKVAEAIEEAIDLEKEIDELLTLKNQARKEIEGVLNQILTLRGDVLHEKYLVLRGEEEIAKVFERTTDTVNRLIREGKEEVQLILDGK